MTNWQHIDTAPTTEDILGYEDGLIDKTWHGWMDEGKPVFVRSDWISWNPTHWMPLPEPPELSNG